MRRSFIGFSCAVVLLGGLVSACSNEARPSSASSAPAAQKGGLPDRDPALAHKLVSEGAVLLDVRTPEEFASKHLDGAVNVPVDEVEKRMAEIDKLTGGDASKPIVVYCQSGGRAAQAKDALVGAGHTKVTNLGGIGNWDKK